MLIVFSVSPSEVISGGDGEGRVVGEGMIYEGASVTRLGADRGHHCWPFANGNMNCLKYPETFQSTRPQDTTNSSPHTIIHTVREYVYVGAQTNIKQRLS